MPISGNKYVTPAWVNDSRTGPFINAAEMLAIGRQLELANVGFDVESKDVLPAAQGHLDKTIAFGNGRAVSVGYNDGHSGMYSDDGETWTAFTDENLPLRCTGLVYGGGYFVAVGNGGNEDKNIAFSKDGITWHQADFVLAAGWSAIAYGDGLYVVLHKSGIIYFARDPSGPWTAATVGSVNPAWNFCCMAYKDGVFVAVESSLGLSKYSSDRGTTWVEGSIGLTGAESMSIAAGNGKFVVVADPDNTYAYSEDGVTWLTGTLIGRKNWTSIAFGNGRFIAVAANFDNAITSTDGVLWTSVNTSISMSGTCCVCIFGRFFVFSTGSTAFVLVGSILAKRIAEALGIDTAAGAGGQEPSSEVITRYGTSNTPFSVTFSNTPNVVLYVSNAIFAANAGGMLLYIPGIDRAYEVIPDASTGAMSMNLITAGEATIWMSDDTTMSIKPRTDGVLNWQRINYSRTKYAAIALY